MPDGEIHQMLGVLLERSEKQGFDMKKLKTGVDIIRTDQINSRREQEFMKSTVIEAREMIDAMAPTVRSHNEIIEKIKPMMSTLQDVDNAHKFGQKSVKVVGWLGAAGILTPLFIWIKNFIHFGP